MRKVATLIAVLGVIAWSLADGRLLAGKVQGPDAGPQLVARAEPLCPLC